MAEVRTAPPYEASSRYESVTIIIVMTGVLMSAVDTTAVVLALPAMMRDLGSSVLSIIWVIMAYLLVITIFGTQVGKLGDIFGRARMYNLGFGVFAAGSLLCGVSATGPEIIWFRVVQGVGGALISSNSGAIIADTFPANRRGRAFGITGFGWSAGAVLGILVGGAFVTFLSWRYIFFINVPIGVVATVVGYVVLRDKTPKVKSAIDFLGMLLFGLGLFSLLTALTEITGSGVTPVSEAEAAAAVPLLVGFVLWERHCSSPLLDISVLRKRVLAASMSAAFFQSLASFAVLFLVIMYLQGPRGLTPWDASLYLIPGYILGGSMAPFAGRLSDRLGAREVASVGLVLQALGILAYTTLALGTPLFIVVLASVLNGAGTSAFFPANNSAVMASAPRRSYGMTSGLLRTFSNVGMVSSFAVALLIAALSIPRQLSFEIFLGVTQISGSLSQAYVDGMRSALLASISLLAVALALSLLRGKEARTEVARNGAGD
ncbi:MAG: MFS transporter [Nitrososphaerota archaeon]|jgi:EmrB/QacA subfamily drug resistance transporter|nr:MFS transporter [Nitrososphaerota archaeon]MDG6941770.1 MFS transporter [Nitrososphaerota archaeon]MDG6947057.1 MFS transporter [Nitrososphaerota archaeon]MDG6950531.1 MFS transporter [Nitrososphaerota archaeon]